MEIRILDTKDIDIYSELSYEYGTVFNRLEWLEMYGTNISIYGIYDNDNKLIGGFDLYKGKQYGFLHITNPPYTPHIGLFYRNKTQNSANSLSFEKSIHQLVTNFLNQLSFSILTLAFPPPFKDMQVYIWDKYKVIPNYTYHYDLTKSVEELNALMAPERRNDIKKALKDEVITKLCKDYKEVKALVIKTFDRKQKDLSEEMLDKILFTYANENNSYAFVSYLNNQPIATSFCIYDKEKAYYLLGGYDSNNKHQGAGANAVWMAAQHAKSIGLKCFDFEGSMIKPVEKYFRGFGGELVPYYTVNKAFLPFEILLKFIKREVF